MRRWLRHSATVLALYAVALHVILFGLSPLGVSAATVDPFSVICHSRTMALGEETPGNSGLVPGHACDHCNLCSATAAPPPPDIALAALAPARILSRLHPVSTAARISLAADPKRARGPPPFA